MSEFIISKEKFSFGILDRAPVADENQCILLYRDKDGENGSYLINNYKKVYTSDIRRGKYNVKVIFSLSTKTSSHSFQVAMKNNGFYFNVNISMSYTLKDIRNYYFKDGTDSIQLVVREVRSLLNKQDGCWGVQQGNNLKKEIEKSVEDILYRNISLKFFDIVVNVQPDENAKKMIRSDIDKDIVIHEQKNDAMVKVDKNEKQREILQSEYQVHEVRAQQLQKAAEAFGPLAPIAMEYLSGEMSGKELYDYIQEKREKDLEILLEARREDFLTDQKFQNDLGEVIGKVDFMNTGTQTRLQDNVSGQIEEKTQEEADVKDGDFL